MILMIDMEHMAKKYCSSVANNFFLLLGLGTSEEGQLSKYNRHMAGIRAVAMLAGHLLGCWLK